MDRSKMVAFVRFIYFNYFNYCTCSYLICSGKCCKRWCRFQFQKEGVLETPSLAHLCWKTPLCALYLAKMWGTGCFLGLWAVILVLHFVSDHKRSAIEGKVRINSFGDRTTSLCSFKVKLKSFTPSQDNQTCWNISKAFLQNLGRVSLQTLSVTGSPVGCVV